MFIRREARLQRRIVASYQPRASNLVANGVNRQIQMSSVLQKVSLVTTDQFCLARADPKGWNRCYQRFIQHISQLSS